MLVDISKVTGAVMVVIVFISSVGNGLTLFVIIRSRSLHNVTGIFLANLAVADLLQSILGMPLIATSAFHNKWIFGDVLCTLSGITNSLFCITSMLTLSAISVDRWLAIVYPFYHHTFLTIPRAKCVIIYVWSQAVLVALFPTFGWSRYVYLPYEFICTVKWEHNKAYTIFLSVTCFALPLIVTIVSYASVMKVACHQAHETLPVTVGEIEVALQVTPHYSPSISDVRATRKPIWQTDCFPDNIIKGETTAPISSNGNFLKYYLNDLELTKDNVILTENPIKLDASTIHRNGVKLDFSEKEAKVPFSKRVLSKKMSFLDLVKRKKRKNSIVPGNSLQKTHNNSIISRVDPVKFREDPNLYRLRSAWTSEELCGHEMGIISEENEEHGTRQNQTSLGDLARQRKWMAVKMKNKQNKERSEAVLQRRKEMKVVLTLAVVNGTFVFCWLPHFIGIMCLTFTSGSCPFSDNFFTITTVLAMLNSGCNPFIYTLTYRRFRKAFKQVLPCFRSNRSRNIDSPVK